MLPAFYLHHNTSGDMLRMLYFEDRWRFIYTDLFDGTQEAQR
ncbi:MAG TPA: hypothetical protein VH700_10450 [Gemmatimonadales bacterium]